MNKRRKQNTAQHNKTITKNINHTKKKMGGKNQFTTNTNKKKKKSKSKLKSKNPQKITMNKQIYMGRQLSRATGCWALQNKTTGT